MRADDPQGLALVMQIGDQSPARFQPRQVDAMDGIDLGLMKQKDIAMPAMRGTATRQSQCHCTLINQNRV